MGTSTNGMLVYGFDLGGGDSEWQIAEAGGWEPEWCGEDEDAVTAAERKLKESVGFTETDWRAEGYFDREQEAEKRVGVTFESYCSDSHTMWALSATTITAYRGDAVPIDFQELEQRRVSEEWDEKLRAACEALGVTPKQEQPKWLLVSYWG